MFSVKKYILYSTAAVNDIQKSNVFADNKNGLGQEFECLLLPNENKLLQPPRDLLKNV